MVVDAITNVTAFVGRELESQVVDLHLRDGRIDQITAPGSVVITNEDANVIDGSSFLAFPGMVDSHDHLRMLAPGLPLAEGLALDDFLRVMWSTQAKMDTTEYRLGALLGTLQRLKCGITTVIDHCYTYHAPGLDEAAITGYENSGVRWVYARGIMTRPYEPVCETWDQAEDNMRSLIDSGRVRAEQLFVAPVSIRQASRADFERSVALAAELGCGLHTHVAETVPEQDLWRGEYGAPPIQALDQIGFLTPRTVLVHCVLLDDTDIYLIAQRGVHVAHCPTNNMKLAKGVARVPDLLAAGVNVVLGLDMMADMHTEIRTAVGLHAVHSMNPRALSPLDALQMATWRGAEASGLGSVTGALVPGLAADIVLMDARSVLQAPLIDPAHAIVYATNAGMVRHVIVDGGLVIRDGLSTLLDEPALLEEVEAVSAAWLKQLDTDRLPWFRGARQ